MRNTNNMYAGKQSALADCEKIQAEIWHIDPQKVSIQLQANLLPQWNLFRRVQKN